MVFAECSLSAIGAILILVAVGSTQIANDTEDGRCSTIEFIDPYWSLQWYLNTNLSAVTVNVMKAWKDCYNGSGIVIGVVDEGVFDNPDLEIDRNISADINSLVPAQKSHGTHVAGIIAGKRNDRCAVGIAFEATIADLRAFTGFTVEQENTDDFADMLVSSLNSVDIYSNSYTHYSDGVSIHPIDGPLLNKIQEGIKQGRAGKGAIYIFSTGNGGQIRDSCAYDGFTNNIYTINVAGVLKDLTRLQSGENCSSIMVSSFTAEGDFLPDSERIYTTDGPNGCTTDFGQNSAAVPMVSGAVALALQANKDLGYRDMMHILTLTSRSTDLFDPAFFQVNGAGLSFSETFGFGLLNIGALVDYAKVWIPVSEKTNCSVSLKEKPMTLVKVEMKIDGSTCNILSTEHVEVKLTVIYEHVGETKFSLTSPSGTKLCLLSGRPNDMRRTNMDITVVSVHFWGENPVGIWTLSPAYEQSESLLNGEIHQIEIIVHGTTDDPLDLQHPSIKRPQRPIHNTSSPVTPSTVTVSTTTPDDPTTTETDKPPVQEYSTITSVTVSTTTPDDPTTTETDKPPVQEYSTITSVTVSTTTPDDPTTTETDKPPVQEYSTIASVTVSTTTPDDPTTTETDKPPVQEYSTITSVTVSTTTPDDPTTTKKPPGPEYLMIIIISVIGGVCAIIIIVVIVAFCHSKLRSQEQVSSSSTFQEARKKYKIDPTSLQPNTSGNIVNTSQLRIEIMPSKSYQRNNPAYDNFMYGRNIHTQL